MNQSRELSESNQISNKDLLPKKNLTQYLEDLKIEEQKSLMKFSQKYGRPDNSTTYCSNTVMQFIIKIRETEGWSDASSFSW